MRSNAWEDKLSVSYHIGLDSASQPHFYQYCHAEPDSTLQTISWAAPRY